MNNNPTIADMLEQLRDKVAGAENPVLERILSLQNYTPNIIDFVYQEMVRSNDLQRLFICKISDPKSTPRDWWDNEYLGPIPLLLRYCYTDEQRDAELRKVLGFKLSQDIPREYETRRQRIENAQNALDQKRNYVAMCCKVPEDVSRRIFGYL